MGRYKFGEIAINSTAKKKPTPADKDSYLGLEHIDSDNLTVTRFGSEVAPIGEKLIMKKGDVLFGKRRAYQKKVAIAPFDGIFSAHGMVLRPKEKIITKDFFPLFISSEYFLNAAINISVGSLSPTINWGDLKELGFELPSIEKQKKLATLLWTAIEAKKAYRQLIFLVDELVKSQFIEMFGDPVTNPMGWKIPYLEELAAQQKNALKAGPFGSSLKKEFYTDAGYKIYGQEQVISGDAFLGNYYISEQKYKDLESCAVQAGDVLISLVGTYGKILVIPNNFEPGIINPRLVKITFDHKKVNTTYFQHFFASESLKNELDSSTHGCTMGVLNLGIIRKLKMPCPPIEYQNRFAAFVEQADKSKFIIISALKRTIPFTREFVYSCPGGR